MAKILNDIGEWVIYPKQSRGSSYARYKNQMKVIVPRQKNLGYLYLTDAVLKALGNPTHVLLATNPSFPNFIGILASNAGNSDAYMVTKKQNTALPMVTASAFLKENIEHRPYAVCFDAELDATGAMVWFNKTNPSAPK